MRQVLAYVAAAGVGVFLLASPFMRYGLGGSHAHGRAPHSNHDARHGGNLFMIGDHHVELVERVDSVELFLSDDERRPVRPEACAASFDGVTEVSCEWKGFRSVVGRPPRGVRTKYELEVPEGPWVTFVYP